MSYNFSVVVNYIINNKHATTLVNKIYQKLRKNDIERSQRIRKIEGWKGHNPSIRREILVVVALLINYEKKHTYPNKWRILYNYTDIHQVIDEFWKVYQFENDSQSLTLFIHLIQDAIMFYLKITEKSTHWNNYNTIIHKDGLIYIVENKDSLQRFVKGKGPLLTPSLRPFSGSYSYSNIIISNQESRGLEEAQPLLLDCTRLKTIQLSSDKMAVTVGSGVTFKELLPYLESKKLLLPNFTGCYILSIGGAFCAAAHGTGFKACIADVVESVLLLNSSGELITVKHDDPLFKLLCGGMGCLGMRRGVAPFNPSLRHYVDYTNLINLLYSVCI